MQKFTKNTNKNFYSYLKKFYFILNEIKPNKEYFEFIIKKRKNYELKMNNKFLIILKKNI